MLIRISDLENPYTANDNIFNDQKNKTINPYKIKVLPHHTQHCKQKTRCRNCVSFTKPAASLIS